jgi:hypothetical protein
MSRNGTDPRYVLCVSNEGYEASLVVRRVYEQVPDAEAEQHKMIRVIDESGEDYLFPDELFAPIRISRAVSRRLASAT